MGFVVLVVVAPSIGRAQSRGQDAALAEATRLNEEAFALYKAGQYSGAEALYLRALAIREKVWGPEHQDVATSLNNLAALYLAQHQYAQAEPLFRRALVIREKVLGLEHPSVAASLYFLATIYYAQGRYAQAEPLLLRALTIWEKAGEAESPRMARGLTSLAFLHQTLGRYVEAEPLYQRALAIQEKVLGAEHPDLALSLNNLADLYREQGRYAQAEPLYRRALAIRERARGPESGPMAQSLGSLALLYLEQGRYAQAEPLLLRALAIYEKVSGLESPFVATALAHLAQLYHKQGRYAQAEPLYQRALAIQEKMLGREHPNVAASLNDLAALYLAQHQYAHAEPLLRRALVIREKALGLEHPHVAASLNNLADLYRGQGQYTQAETLFRRALAIWEKAVGQKHPNLALTLNNIAYMLVLQQQPALARALFERARRVQLAVAQVNVDLDGEAHRSLLRAPFWALRVYTQALATIARDAALDLGPRPAAMDAFVVVEHERGGLAQAALAKSSARVAVGDPVTSDLARQVQDLRNRREAVGKQLTAEYGKPTAQRNEQRFEALKRELQKLDGDLTEPVNRLNKAFPNYAELASPEPIDVAAVRQMLRANEALISFFTIEDRMLVWLVQKGNEPVYRDIEIKKTRVSELVARVRTSLDQTANPDLRAGLLVPFDVAGSHELFKLLIAPLREHLAGVKHLIIVPDEVVLPLPFGVLVTRAGGEPYQRLAELYRQQRHPAPAELAAYVKLDWLAKAYAITVLPSATSLRALRQIARAKGADTEPFIGFGDPLLQGGGTRRGGGMLAARGPGVPVEVLRQMNRLPGTRDELLAVARALGADPHRAVYVEAQATKPTIMSLNTSGRLGKARVLAFATHGLLAGELTGLTQPALVLTPPATPSEEDDGLLALEDILGLKLPNTDWVILSACNTAADDGSGEGLAGLVRAFFFAGAQALLVSHWSVEDRATQALMTEVFRRQARDKALPPAETLRQGMLGLMARARGPTAYFAHPFAWAAFFLVGEGGPAGGQP